MSYTEKQIAHEQGKYWVLDLGAKGFEVYETGVTHSTRRAIIGFIGEKGLERAKAEIARRIDIEAAREWHREEYRTGADSVD